MSRAVSEGNKAKRKMKYPSTLASIYNITVEQSFQTPIYLSPVFRNCVVCLKRPVKLVILYKLQPRLPVYNDQLIWGQQCVIIRFFCICRERLCVCVCVRACTYMIILMTIAPLHIPDSVIIPHHHHHQCITDNIHHHHHRQ